MKGLLNKLYQDKVVKSQIVYNTMLQVDRADFIEKDPYCDDSQYLGYHVVISAPHMHAYALEYLYPALKNFLNFNPKNFRLLDIGSGSGYLTVCLSKLIKDQGTVIGIEHIPELYQKGENNIKKHHKNLLDEKKIELYLGDGRTYFKDKPLFKCIHVGAAAVEPPKEFLDQLDVGGRLVIPLGTKNYNSSDQFIYFIDKLPNGQFNYTKGLSVRYVDLTTVEMQSRGFV